MTSKTMGQRHKIQTDSRGFSSISNDDDGFAENGAVAEIGEGLRRFFEAIGFVHDRFEFADCRPVERGDHIGTVSSITPDEALLFHEKGPEIHLHFTAGSRAASDDSSAAGEAVERLLEHFAADVFDDDVDAAAIGYLANFIGPLVGGGIDDVIGAGIHGEVAFLEARGGGDDVGAKLLCDLNGGGTDAACASHDENPIGGGNPGAIGEHVHGGAAGESERGGSFEGDFVWNGDEGARGDENFLGEAAVFLDAEHLAFEAD